MAKNLSISIPDTERDLIDWLNKQIEEKAISPSDLFQQALKEKKKEWDILQSISAEQLLSKIRVLEQTITTQKETMLKFSEFIENKKLTNEWVDFRLKEPTKKVKIQRGGKTIINASSTN